MYLRIVPNSLLIARLIPIFQVVDASLDQLFKFLTPQLLSFQLRLEILALNHLHVHTMPYHAVPWHTQVAR